MAVLSLGLVFVPLIPGLRDIPRWVPIYRLIWRSYLCRGGVDATDRSRSPCKPDVEHIGRGRVR